MPQLTTKQIQPRKQSKELPWFGDVSNTMSKGFYAVHTVVFIRQKQCWILETNEFKLWISQSEAEEAWLMVDSHLAKDEAIYIFVDRLGWAIASDEFDLGWRSIVDEKKELWSCRPIPEDIIESPPEARPLKRKSEIPF